jgi:hypothetical protein
MSITPRRMLAVALAASVAAGCGQGTSSTTSTAPPSGKASARTVLQAAAATTNAGSARFTMRMVMSTASGSLTMHGSGETTFSHPVHAAMNLAMQLPQSSNAMSVSERLIGTTIYMNMPFLSDQLPGNKPWVKFDLEALGKMQGMDLGSLMNSNTESPATVLAFLQGVSSNIKNLGSQTVQGVQTTHYRATVSPQRMLARLQKIDPKAVSTYRQTLQQTGMSSEPIDVWIDNQGLLRQETVHTNMPALNASMSFTMDLSDFGVKVNIMPPPASQTTDLLQLIKQSQSSTGGA